MNKPQALVHQARSSILPYLVRRESPGNRTISQRKEKVKGKMRKREQVDRRRMQVRKVFFLSFWDLGDCWGRKRTSGYRISFYALDVLHLEERGAAGNLCCETKIGGKLEERQDFLSSSFSLETHSLSLTIFHRVSYFCCFVIPYGGCQGGTMRGRGERKRYSSKNPPSLSSSGSLWTSSSMP